MQKTAILTAMLIVLTGCTTHPQALNYRPKGSDSAPYVITSKVNNLTNNLQVFFDGQKVVEGTLSFGDLSGQFFGLHEGHKVNVSCIPSAITPRCAIQVDGEAAGNI